ncbi:heme-binding protein [Ideonella sp. DXS29W]|uniref:Heme-binding protein n=1 Tax=Ideonella lacteola TaxID=2984193 RepID=A0ABU9BP79_9BURK
MNPTTSALTYSTIALTRDAALSLASAARAASQAMGIDVSIAITDAAGHLKAFERSDRAGLLTAEVAIDKAWTAASFGVGTDVWNRILQDGQIAQLAHRPRLVAVAGGCPIVAQGQVVGAIGISGGTAQQDHDAAITALKSLGFEVAPS